MSGGRSRLGGGRSKFRSGGSRMKHGKVKGMKGATTKNSEKGREPIYVGGLLVNPKP